MNLFYKDPPKFNGQPASEQESEFENIDDYASESDSDDDLEYTYDSDDEYEYDYEYTYNSDSKSNYDSEDFFGPRNNPYGFDRTKLESYFNLQNLDLIFIVGIITLSRLLYYLFSLG